MPRNFPGASSKNQKKSIESEFRHSKLFGRRLSFFCRWRFLFYCGLTGGRLLFREHRRFSGFFITGQFRFFFARKSAETFDACQNFLAVFVASLLKIGILAAPVSGIIMTPEQFPSSHHG